MSHVVPFTEVGEDMKMAINRFLASDMTLEEIPVKMDASVEDLMKLISDYGITLISVCGRIKVKIYEIKQSNVSCVAELMSKIKPEWWNFDDAMSQLQNVHMLAELHGWCMGDSEDEPCGWILCAGFAGYSYLTIECLGFDSNGAFVMEEQLEPLIIHAEAYAKEKGYRNLKYVISSIGMSCHDKVITNYAEELKGLKSYNRKHYDYFVNMGFVPAGFIPNCYGNNYHGIIMIKDLTAYDNFQFVGTLNREEKRNLEGE